MSGYMLDTPEQIQHYRLFVMLRGLELEIAGLKMRGGSCYAMAKREFGFKGNKTKVYNQLATLLNKPTI
jgi:hypothetical protein